MAKEDRSSNDMDMEVCEMQKAEHIISLLGQKSQNRPDFVFQRLYRHLYNPGIYYLAMERYPFFNRSQLYRQIDPLIQELRVERCDWKNRQKMILLQYAMTVLLQAIFQPLALPCAKPNRKQALRAIQSIPPPFGWSIKMPSIEVYRRMDPDRWDGFLKKKIRDGRFLTCIRQYVRRHGWPVEWIDLLLQEFDQWLVNEPYDLVYVRYQGHQFLLVRGSKADAQRCMKRIEHFLMDRLGIKGMGESRNVQLLAKEGLQFADYELQVVDHQRIGVFVSKTTVDTYLRPFRKQENPKAFSSRIHQPIERIIDLYRRERKEFEAFCSLAWNGQKRIRYFRYVHFASLLKTIARKQNRSVKQVRKQYETLVKRYLT